MGDADLLVPASALANDKAWAIVRRLAELSPLERMGSSGLVRCWFCGKLDNAHTETCLHRNAREVLDAQA